MPQIPRLFYPRICGKTFKLFCFPPMLSEQEFYYFPQISAEKVADQRRFFRSALISDINQREIFLGIEGNFYFQICTRMKSHF